MKKQTVLKGFSLSALLASLAINSLQAEQAAQPLPEPQLPPQALPAPVTPAAAPTPAVPAGAAPAAATNSAAVAANTASADAPLNYSLWPRRPQQLDDARKLVKQGHISQAHELIKDLLEAEGVAGAEARALYGDMLLNALLQPGAEGQVQYEIKRGDNCLKIARQQNCPMDLMLHLNPNLQPNRLSLGEKLWLLPLDFSVKIRLGTKEVCLYRQNNFIKAWPIVGNLASTLKAGEHTTVKSESGEVAGRGVTTQSEQFAVANKVIHLANGLRIEAAGPNSGGRGIFMAQADVNELSLLLNNNSKIEVLP